MSNNYFHGSYKESDVNFLITILDGFKETSIEQKEEFIKSGEKHYSQMISKECELDDEYMKMFYRLLYLNIDKFVAYIYDLALNISKLKLDQDIVIVSLLRAGTPIGVLLNRVLNELLNHNTTHYSISIIRDRGIDEVALDEIRKHHDDSSIVFVDGWGGKGVIANELSKSIIRYNVMNSSYLDDNLYTILDLSGLSYTVTNDDFFIPSSALNSTISGLISRSILTDEIIDGKLYHGALYYKEFESKDISLWFVNKSMKYLTNHHINNNKQSNTLINKNLELNKTRLNYLNLVMVKYSVSHINYIKPGIGECTRVLLRRSPKLIIVKSLRDLEVEHILMLANDLNVNVIEDSSIPYSCLGIIK